MLKHFTLAFCRQANNSFFLFADRYGDNGKMELRKIIHNPSANAHHTGAVLLYQLFG
jgi:hypothetical protein